MKASLARFRDDIDVSPVPVDDDVVTDIQFKERVFQPLVYGNYLHRDLVLTIEMEQVHSRLKTPS